MALCIAECVADEIKQALFCVGLLKKRHVSNRGQHDSKTTHRVLEEAFTVASLFSWQ